MIRSKHLSMIATVVSVLAWIGQAQSATLYNEDFAAINDWQLGFSGSTPWTTLLNDGDETVVIAGGAPINTYAMPSNNQVLSAGITSAINALTTLNVNLDVRLKSFATGNEFFYTLFSQNPQVVGDIAAITLNVRHPSNAASGGSVNLLISRATTNDPAGNVTVFNSGFTPVTLGDDGDPFPINVSRSGAGQWTVTVDGNQIISGSESTLTTGLKIDFIRFQELADSLGGAERRVFDNFSISTTVIPEPGSVSLLCLGLVGLLRFRRRRA